MENATSPFLGITSHIPGFALFSTMLQQYFSIDLGYLVSIYLVLYGLCEPARYVLGRLHDIILNNFTSYIEVQDSDTLWSNIRDWSATHDMTKGGRELIAKTEPRGTEGKELSTLEDNPDGFFHYGQWYIERPIYYRPAFNMKFFFHEQRMIQWTKGVRKSKTHDDGYILFYAFRCLGRDPQPIKDLLKDIKKCQKITTTKCTHILRAAGGDSEKWLTQALKSPRPMQTIYLQERLKAQLILDINEYLLPGTSTWYETRGIPYRRGYLFHGPPGTGKTSLSFALAGLFGLSIYCVSLGERGLTESKLSGLFSELPSRCIVLLEDIDTAGVDRDVQIVADERASSSDTDGDERNKRRKKVSRKEFTKNGNRGQISLAALLNIIDGAASQEGRVLIMTTNHPETLDSALIRPGRIDLQIEFTLSTQDQIGGMFTRMYTADRKSRPDPATRPQMQQWEQIHLDVKPATSKVNLSKWKDVPFDLTPYMAEKGPEFVGDLHVLADEFAKLIPDRVFSPAEVQGYLLTKKRDPVAAVRDAKAWIDKQRQKKGAGAGSGDTDQCGERVKED